jgi:hypothetical protein
MRQVVDHAPPFQGPTTLNVESPVDVADGDTIRVPNKYADREGSWR